MSDHLSEAHGILGFVNNQGRMKKIFGMYFGLSVVMGWLSMKEPACSWRCNLATACPPRIVLQELHPPMISF
jgi:hypothetical protein